MTTTELTIIKDLVAASFKAFNPDVEVIDYGADVTNENLRYRYNVLFIDGEAPIDILYGALEDSTRQINQRKLTVRAIADREEGTVTISIY